MYLYAIIDVYSRCIVDWGLYNTLDAANAIEVLEAAIKRLSFGYMNRRNKGIRTLHN